MVVELFASDMEDKMQVYSTLERLAQEFSPDRVFIGGDIAHHIDYDAVRAHKEAFQAEEGFTQLKEDFEQARDMVSAYLQENYDGELKGLVNAVQSGQGSEDDKEAFQNHLNAMQIANILNTEHFAREAKDRYDPHNEAIKKIKEYCPDVYATFGNHDTIFAENFIPAATFGHREQQPLIGEKIALGYNVGYGTEVNEQFNGPNLMFAPEPDDSQESLDKSFAYQAFKDKELELIVVHNSGMHQAGEANFNERYPSGLGFKKLAEEQRCIVYAGHIDHGAVFKDPSGAIIIRPGSRYVAAVEREGKSVKSVELIPID